MDMKKEEYFLIELPWELYCLDPFSQPRGTVPNPWTSRLWGCLLDQTIYKYLIMYCVLQSNPCHWVLNKGLLSKSQQLKDLSWIELLHCVTPSLYRAFWLVYFVRRISHLVEILLWTRSIQLYDKEGWSTGLSSHWVTPFLSVSTFNYFLVSRFNPSSHHLDDSCWVLLI